MYSPLLVCKDGFKNNGRNVPLIIDHQGFFIFRFQFLECHERKPRAVSEV